MVEGEGGGVRKCESKAAIAVLVLGFGAQRGHRQ